MADLSTGGETRRCARLLAIRHAPAAVQGLCYGRIDVAVTLDAATAANSIIAALQSTRPDVVWTSAAARCRDPARIVASSLCARLIVDERLAELDFGHWEGRYWHEIEANDGLALRRWMDDWLRHAPPGGESVEDLTRRVAAWAHDLDPDALHLLSAHAGVVRALAVIARAQSWQQAMSRDVPALQVLEFPVLLHRVAVDNNG